MEALRFKQLNSCVKLLTKSFSSKPLQKHYDVVVVGGGMVGFGFAAFAGIFRYFSYLFRITPDVKK